jgi:hypothetical protein
MLPGLPSMSGRFGVALQRFARWIERRRVAILVASLLVLAVAGTVAARLPIRSDISHLLPPETPSVVALRELERRLPSSGMILVVAESEDPARRARAIELLATRLRAIDHDLVDRIAMDDREARDFVWQNRFLFAELADLRRAAEAVDGAIRRAKLSANPLYIDLEDEDDVPDDEQAEQAAQEGLAELRRQLDSAREERAGPGGFISRDGRMQLLVVRTTFSNSSLSLADRLVADLEPILASVQRDVGPGVTVSAQGDVYTALAEHRALTRGVVTATVLTVVVVALGLFLYFRSVLGLVALFFSMAVGTMVTFALTRLIIGHLNLATAFLSPIVVGNGINAGLILLARFEEERRAGKRGADAIDAAVSGTFASTLAAALTASVAYASLSVTSFEGFQHFGVIGGMGMVVCWASAYLVMPAALAVLERWRGLATAREPALGRLAGRLQPRNPVLVAGVGLLVTGLASIGAFVFLTGEPLEKSMKSMLSDSDELVAMRERLQRVHAALSLDTGRTFVLAAPDRQTARQVAAALREADRGVPAERRLLREVESLDDAVPRDQAAKLALLDDIRRGIDEIAPELSGAERDDMLALRPPDDLKAIGDADLPDMIAARFSEKDGTRGRLVLAHAPREMDIDHIPSLIGFAHSVRGLDLGEGVMLGGSMFVFADVLQHMELDGPRATIAATIGALLVVLLLVGANRRGLITLTCCASGTALMLACVWLLGLKGNVLDFIALPITIGIGIDYSVNIVMRARDERGGVGEALRTVGGAVIMCSFTTVVGYGSLLLSANRGIRSFGAAAILGEVTCLLAALALAPALLQLWRRAPR